jgi:hypothetical protein
MKLEKHYVILPNLTRFRAWAQENVTEEWLPRGHGAILTDTKEYRAVTAMHHLRGAALTPETLHWAVGWHMGMTPRGALELERYVQMCLAMGERVAE